MQLRFVVLAAALGACSSPLGQARTSFDEARFPEAAAEFRRLQPGELGRADLFEYALYRGLTHLALGDAVPAQRWLRLAKRLSEESPELASFDDRGRLLAAFRSMGLLPGDPAR